MFFLLFLALLFFPSEIYFVDFRGLIGPLVIERNLNSPSLAARQDTRVEFLDNTKTVQNTSSQITLKAGPISFNQVQMTSPQTALKTVTKRKTKKSHLAYPFAEKDILNHFNRSFSSPVEAQAFRLVQEALSFLPPKEKGSKMIPTQSGKAILVAKSKTQSQKIAQFDKPILKSNTPSVPENDKFVSQKSKHLKIEGNISFQDGLGADGRYFNVFVYHSKNGVKQNEGVVFFRDARFEVHVDSLEGFIVGEVRNPSGRVLGRGQLDLKKTSLDKMNLSLRPKSSYVQVATISANTFEPHKKFIPWAQVHFEDIDYQFVQGDKGIFLNRSLDASSSFFMQASYKGHWGTLARSMSEDKMQELKIFPQKMVEALLDAVLDKYQSFQARKQGVIWGQVLVNGKPISGAQVQLAEQGEEEKLVYFKGVLPNASLHQTSSNGVFAFVNVSPGLKALRVRWNGHWWPAEIVKTASGYVSYVKIQGSPLTSFEAEAFDAFSGQPLATQFRVLGVDKEFSTLEEESSLIQISGGQGLMFVEAEPLKDYTPSRYIAHKTSRIIYMPMVKKDWLNSLAQQEKQVIHSHLGIIVGFVQGDNFEVFLPSVDNKEKSDIIYFNKQGQVTEGLDGGGFVIFNVDPGVQTVILQPLYGQKAFSQTIAVDPSMTSLLSVDIADGIEI